MSCEDDYGLVREPFGPEHVRPHNTPCTGCSCCTAELCAMGRASVKECAGHVADGMEDNVRGCPCSAESTRGTLAWRAGMVRAVTFATEKPLREDLERLLRRIADGEQYGGFIDLLPKLTVRRYVTCPEGEAPQLTDFGRAYLAARGQEPRRTQSFVTVASVDTTARTAEVIVAAFSADQPVTVPLDQIATSQTGLTPASAPGVTLYAEVNAYALTADDVVLTKVRNPIAAAPPQPGGYLAGLRTQAGVPAGDRQ